MISRIQSTLMLWNFYFLSLSFNLVQWHESQDVHCPQLNRCIQISQLCLEDDQHKRPTIGCIIDMLNDMKTTTTETIVSPGFGHSRNNSGSSEEYVYLQWVLDWNFLSKRSYNIRINHVIYPFYYRRAVTRHTCLGFTMEKSTLLLR